MNDFFTWQQKISSLRGSKPPHLNVNASMPYTQPPPPMVGYPTIAVIVNAFGTDVTVPDVRILQDIQNMQIRLAEVIADQNVIIEFLQHQLGGKQP